MTLCIDGRRAIDQEATTGADIVAAGGDGHARSPGVVEVEARGRACDADVGAVGH